MIEFEDIETLADKETLVEDIIELAQEGWTLVIAFVFSDGFKMICEDIGMPYAEALRRALEEV